MVIRGMVLTLAAVALTTGCYFETIDDRAPGAIGDSNKGLPLRDGEGNCHLELTKGCFDGNVISMKEFVVDGKQFFNADDLSTRFAELITIQDDDGNALVSGTDYQLALTSDVDNRSFVREFSYDLTGKLARRDQVRSDGNFSINDLPEGSYDVRLQRPVKFDILSKVERAPSPDSPDELPVFETQKKSYCATIYADTVIEIRKGERTWASFNDFQLHVTDDECTASGTQTTLSL